MKERWPILLATGMLLGSVFVETHQDFVSHPASDLETTCDQLIKPDLCKAAAAANLLRHGKIPMPMSGQSNAQGQSIPPARPLPLMVAPRLPTPAQEQQPVRVDAQIVDEQPSYEVPSILDESPDLQP